MAGAPCEICNKSMMRSKGCLDKDYVIDGKRYPAVPYVDIYGSERCHDCNCKDGEFHHTGCDMERCPLCNGQFIMCDCPIEEEMYVFPKGRKKIKNETR
jgi:hypothetical protein